MRELVKGLEIKEMIGPVLENDLEGELDEELECNKYDYKNRETNNYLNGHTKAC